ncbi:hypothetical protein L4D18_21890 [Vibrio campbellii]|uniref:hypothetical protein n=1 Tax=Vibrio campbellii TaxID=680 RepID=UPI003D104B3F
MKHLTFMVSALCLSGNVLAKVTYEDAVKSSAALYSNNNAVNIPPTKKVLGADEKQNTTGANLVRKTLFLSSDGIHVGNGRSIRLREDIDDYVQLRLTYRLQFEDVGVHTRTMTIGTALWKTDPSHSSSKPLYRYTDTSGADKNRWSAIHFWRTDRNHLYTRKMCDRHCNVHIVAVEGIK